MENSVSSKRSRDESTDVPDSKRANIIFNILDDDDNDGDPSFDPNPTAGVLADVIKSLEEEIVAPQATEAEEAGESSQLDLGYLLEASDDDLGLPPAVKSPSTSPIVDGVDGFDRIWGFEDDVKTASPYEDFGFGAQAEFDESVLFDGGMFDYGDGVFGPFDAEEFPWHTAAV